MSVRTEVTNFFSAGSFLINHSTYYFYFGVNKQKISTKKIISIKVQKLFTYHK